MSKLLQIRIISPDSVVFEGEAASIQYPGGDGLIGILPRHAPMITTVDAGVLKLVGTDGKAQFLALGRGFVSIKDDQVEFAVDSGEAGAGIDVERARRAAERARERLHMGSETETIDLARAEYALKRAMVRLQAGGGRDQHASH